MLTRLQYRRSYRLIVRSLSDKTQDADDKITQQKKHESTEEGSKENKKNTANVEKIQELLKTMMQENKINEEEYRKKFATAPIIPRKRKPKADEIEVKIEKIEENLTVAAGEVAQAIGGDVKQTEAELLSKVLGKISQTSTTLSDLISGMKVDRTKEDDGAKPINRGQQVKQWLATKKMESQGTGYSQRKDKLQRPRETIERTRDEINLIDLFSEQPLGIFTKKEEPNYGTKLDVWESLQQRELTLATSQAPTNYFQKMIQWTEQGKVWKFPINNEQGLEEEDKVHFSEHIFLDTLLEDWCPKKGPIRHFMELVCVGLSKNAFYTVQEKRDHIMWYKEYFESKKDVLTEVGAWDIPSKQQKIETPA